MLPCKNEDEFDSAIHAAPALNLLVVDSLIRIVALPEGFGLLPLALSTSQVSSWTGMKKTLVRDLINDGEIQISKVKGRTLVALASVLDMMERRRVQKGQR